jgi:hypothetical protein
MNTIVVRSFVLVTVVLSSLAAIGCGGAGVDARPVANVSANTPVENHALDRTDRATTVRR